MADQKISELTNITGANLADADEFVVVDVSADQTKAVTRAEFFKDTPDITATGTVTAGGLTVDGGANSELRIDTDAAGYLQVGQFTNGAFIGTSSTNATYGKLRLGAGTKRFIDVGTNGDISFYEDTGTQAKFFWDASTERLGIGTAAPATKLHIEGGSLLVDAYSVGEDAGIFLREGFLTIDQPSITVWDKDNGGASPDGISINGSDGIRFRENGGEVARFDDGNFGIGDASPSEALSVTGNIAATGTVTSGDRLAVDNTTGSPDQILMLLQADMGTQDRNMQIVSPATDSTEAPFRFATANSFAFQIDANQSALVIQHDAKVGIGDASPSEALSVTGNIAATGTVTATGATVNGNLSVSSATPLIKLLETDTSNQHRIIATGGSLYIQAQDSDGTNDGDLHLTGHLNDDLNLLNIKAVTTAMNGNLTATGTVTATSYTEAVFAVTGTTPALDPANGSIQTWTLSAASTPTSNLSSGESMTLMIEDGTAYSITWPTMTWVNNGGAAPTLATSGKTVVALWNVAGNLYGSFVGNGS